MNDHLFWCLVADDKCALPSPPLPIVPQVEKEFPLESIGAAYQTSSEHKVVGKLAITL